MEVKGIDFIREITSFIFIEDKPEKADIIFVPGGLWPEPMEKASELWLKGYAPYILPSGKYSLKNNCFTKPAVKAEKYNKKYLTEYEFMKDIGLSCGVDDKAIFKEDNATWTKENAFYSRKITDENDLEIRKAIICCKSFHAKRAIMFYSFAYPKTKFIICPVNIENINKDNWFKTEYGIDNVMGELSRCGGQLKKAVSMWSES